MEILRTHIRTWNGMGRTTLRINNRRTYIHINYYDQALYSPLPHFLWGLGITKYLVGWRFEVLYTRFDLSANR